MRVVYAINRSRPHLAAARVSCASALSLGGAQECVVHTFGPPPPQGWRRYFPDPRVALVAHEATPAIPYFMKWRAIESTEANDFLFLDADTVVFAPLSEIRSPGSTGLLAREEMNCERGGPQVDHAILHSLTRCHDAWVMNSGMMRFTGGAHRRVLHDLPGWRRLTEDFERGRAVYPSTNPHILEEVVASVMVTRSDIAFVRATQQECLFYEEARRPIAELAHRTVVLHTWARYMPWLQPGLEQWLGLPSL